MVKSVPLDKGGHWTKETTLSIAESKIIQEKIMVGEIQCKEDSPFLDGSKKSTEDNGILMNIPVIKRVRNIVKGPYIND